MIASCAKHANFFSYLTLSPTFFLQLIQQLHSQNYIFRTSDLLKLFLSSSVSCYRITPFPFSTFSHFLCQSHTPLSGYHLVLVFQGTHHSYLPINFSLGQNLVQSDNSCRQHLYSLEDNIVSKARQTLSYTLLLAYHTLCFTSKCKEVKSPRQHGD